jgi:transmembrane sensor
MMEDKNIEELIGKCLTGEASIDEQMQLGSWRIASPENEKHYQQLETIYQQAAKVYQSERYDVDAAWHKVKSKTKQKGQIWLFQPVALRIAAGLALMAAASILFLWFQSTDEVKPLLITSTQTVVHDTLPNGVPVVLNKQSQLQILSDKNKKQTTVKLTGEAEFNIKPGTTDKLLVQADVAFIKHIGTHFNVQAYPDGNIEVTVFEGRVKFYTKATEGIFIDAGGKGIYDKTLKTFTSVAASANTQAYHTRQFAFENLNLQSIAEQLNRVYDQKLIIPDHLKSCPITVSFNNEPLSEIAHILAETLGLTVTAIPDGFQLDGNGCY